MINDVLLRRLRNSHPGWDVYDQLLSLVESLDFERIDDETTGTFIASGNRLVFAEHNPRSFDWPDWLPSFVPALYGMKADDYEMAGGFADAFSNVPAKRGSVFNHPYDDQELGYPLIEVPGGTHPFQRNSSGATFFLSQDLQVLYPNSADERFEVLDSLEDFTKTCIKQTLVDAGWFAAYSSSVKGTLMD
jgi:hypothetical protein